jgi:hypothetical protein
MEVVARCLYEYKGSPILCSNSECFGQDYYYYTTLRLENQYSSGLKASLSA